MSLLEKLKPIILDKGGQLLSDENKIGPFSDCDFRCINNHFFKANPNKIIHLNEWCPQCEKSDKTIGQCLTSLAIDYIPNYIIDDVVVDFYVHHKELSGDKKYIFMSKSHPKIEEYCRINKFHYIIYNGDFCNSDSARLKTIILKGMSKNEPFLLDGIKDANRIISMCTREVPLDNVKGDVGSFVKYNDNFSGKHKKAIGYVRVSTDMQVKDGFSLGSQETNLYKFAQARSMEIAALYIDKGITGQKMDNRLALQQMLKDCSEDTTIIVKSVDRISRNTLDLIKIVKELKDKNSKILILDLDIDFSTPVGEVLLTLMGSLGQMEVRITSERIRTVMQTMMKEKTLRTKPPYGYKINPSKTPGEPHHIPDEDEQAVIEIMRKLTKKEEYTSTSLAAKLNNMHNVPAPRKSKKWYHKFVSDICEREKIPLKRKNKNENK